MKENHHKTFCLFFFASVQKYSSVGLLNSVVFAPVSQLLALRSCQHASAPMPARQTLPCLSHLTIKAIPMQTKEKKKGGGLQKKIPRQEAQTFVTQQSFHLHLSSPSINTIGSLVIFVYSPPLSGKKNKKITNKTLRSFQRT